MHGVTLLSTSRLDVLWLDDNFALQHSTWNQINYKQAYFPTALGGSFTSAPVAVAVDADRLALFGLGTDYALYFKLFDTSQATTSAALPWQSLGGSFLSAPAVVSTANDSLDLFAVNSDGSLVRRAWNGTAFAPVQELGGGFTGTPVVLPAAAGAFDVFARGMDFKIHHATVAPNAVPVWHAVGGNFLNAPTAASVPCALRTPSGVFLFVTGDDGAIWTTLFDGRAWKPWGSLGPAQRPKPTPNVVNLGARPPNVITFTSEPTATAFYPATSGAAVSGGLTASTTKVLAAAAPEVALPQPPAELRIDLFAVGSDGTLWHKWLDAVGWHGETDPSNASLQTGNWLQVPPTAPPVDVLATSNTCACIPTLINTGSARSATAMPSVGIKMVQPSRTGQVCLLSYDGSNWESWQHGPVFRLPSHYVFSVDGMQIKTLRSAHHDTDLVVATLSVGKWPIQTATFGPTDVSNQSYSFSSITNNLMFRPQLVELGEPVVFTYTIVNTSKGSAVATTLQSLIVKGAQAVASAELKSTIAALGIFGSAVLGPAVGAVIGIVLDPLLALVFADCDGVVAAESRTWLGRDLQKLVTGAHQKYQVSTEHFGSDSNAGCGSDNSDYVVNWSITEVTLG